MKKSLVLWLLLLASCAPKTHWVEARGRNFGADMRECEYSADLAITQPYEPYQPPPPGSNFYSAMGDALGKSMTNLGNTLAQKELYVNQCMELQGHDLVFDE